MTQADEVDMWADTNFDKGRWDPSVAWRLHGHGKIHRESSLQDETPKKNRRQYAKTRKNIRKSMNILQPQKKTTQLLNSEIMVHDSNLLSLFIPNKISPVYHGPHWSHRSRPTAPGHLFIHQAVTGLAEVPAAAAVHGGSRLHHPGGRMRPLKRCRHGWYISWMMWLAKVMLYIYMYMYVHIYVYIYIITGVYIYILQLGKLCSSGGYV